LTLNSKSISRRLSFCFLSYVRVVFQFIKNKYEHKQWYQRKKKKKKKGGKDDETVKKDKKKSKKKKKKDSTESESSSEDESSSSSSSTESESESESSTSSEEEVKKKKKKKKKKEEKKKKKKGGDGSSAEGLLAKKLNYIGILDIYGFERLQQNYFEQLCINLANERLQQFFEKKVLVAEQQLYEREGLPRVEVYNFNVNEFQCNRISFKRCTTNNVKHTELTPF